MCVSIDSISTRLLMMAMVMMINMTIKQFSLMISFMFFFAHQSWLLSSDFRPLITRHSYTISYCFTSPSGYSNSSWIVCLWYSFREILRFISIWLVPQARTKSRSRLLISPHILNRIEMLRGSSSSAAYSSSPSLSRRKFFQSCADHSWFLTYLMICLKQAQNCS
jgi:hypothetical protein